MKAPPKPTFRQRLWLTLEAPVLILLGDIILFLIVLAALVVVYAGVAGMKALGMRPDRVDVLETMHWYAYLAVAFILLLDMLAKILLRIFEKRAL